MVLLFRSTSQSIDEGTLLNGRIGSKVQRKEKLEGRKLAAAAPTISCSPLTAIVTV